MKHNPTYKNFGLEVKIGATISATQRFRTAF